MIAITLTTWDIGLSSWIIQDGNYPDFVAGQEAEFAVEFYWPPKTPLQPCSAEVFAQPVTDALYRVVARKIFASQEITVLDVGILVYHDGSSPFPDDLGRFQTEVRLGVDLFFYFETHSQDPSVPPLVYSWRINSILRQTAPFIEAVRDSGPFAGRTVQVRDGSKLGYEQISATKAWQDDDGHGEYVLRCDLLPIPPKRVSATAT
jgi:hypothetical protein